MTETDATKRPLEVPDRFVPYLEKYRIYKIFKDMLKDLILDLPKDHLKHMKQFVGRLAHGSKEADRVIILVSPSIKIDVQQLAKDMIKDLGVFVITRRCVLDRYQKHDDYEPGCISPVLMAIVTKSFTVKDPVRQAGWLMFDHPCTVREARCLQQEGVLPTTTLVLIPPPQIVPPTHNPHTPARTFFEQDFEGLKFAYKATLKEVYINEEDDPETITTKCINAVNACAAGAQNSDQGHHVVGAPGVYRVVIIGPRGSGRTTQAKLLAKQFGLVFLQFEDLVKEARQRDDEIGKSARCHGPSVQTKAEIVKRRLSMKDCIDRGWVMIRYPSNGADFDELDKMPTPPNRIIVLNTSLTTCKKRLTARYVDWCTGKEVADGSSPRAVRRPENHDDEIDNDLDVYFSETLAELRAAAGITAVDIDAHEPIDKVHVKIQAAVIAAPAYDIEFGSPLRNVNGD